MMHAKMVHTPIGPKHIGVTVVAFATSLIAYLLMIRPWHVRWGATKEEIHRHLPGDELIPHPKTQSTRAITIKAASSDVWPWLVQMGVGRGGFYSYDWLENLLPIDLGIRSADCVIAEWQHLKVGDIVPWNREEGLPVSSIGAPRVLILERFSKQLIQCFGELQPSGVRVP